MYYVQRSYSSSYHCGILWWSTCYRIHYNSHLQYASHRVYHVQSGCCSGYHSAGGECVSPADAPVNVIVEILNSTAIYIQWDPPLAPNGIIILYTVYINGSLLLNVNATSGTQNISLDGFSPYQIVNVSLSASTEVGEGPLTNTQSVTTHESVPGPVRNLKVVAPTAKSLHISWNPPRYPNGALTGYIVLVTSTTEIISRIIAVHETIIIESGIRKLMHFDKGFSGQALKIRTLSFRTHMVVFLEAFS
ncbi:Phosphatidylinositol phosphatase PTPRQ [Geodia barretti]|uniref:Phosphatidylinositol phosphatase PTPRQ n=1 Tax=Geodia barretti TaxID=519541 RepID=A0AA35XGW5_GEOBA|nr:Phosphatidylinositol phosphatase PTPRQ [Geodia barretti]